jgi:hypothetical protein
MAEYVRRKRPPASHPYWARLHDRAHPPSVLLPVIVPAVLGLLIGQYGGSRPPYLLSSAVVDAGKYAGASAAVLFVIAALVAFHDASRHSSIRERIFTSLGSGLLVGVVVFGLFFVVLGLGFIWMSICSGLGLWLGMLTGILIGAVPGATFAWATRRSWRTRQRHWPRWERVRRRRQSPPPAVTVVQSLQMPTTEPKLDRPEPERSAE